jgi:hypothetical protein
MTQRRRQEAQEWRAVCKVERDGVGRKVTQQGQCGLSHIMADSRQIIWRKSLRSLCKHSTMTQKVLPHNLAWPFLPFLPSWCGPLSVAILCGRKKLTAPKVALMLTQRVLPDNVAPPIFSQIFLGHWFSLMGTVFAFCNHHLCHLNLEHFLHR